MPTSRSAHFDPALDAWVLSSYSDVSAALREKHLSAASASSAGKPGSFDEVAHSQFRDLARVTFSNSRIQEWQGRIRPLAQRILEVAEPGRTLDLVSEFAEPWSLAVATIVTGARTEDSTRLNGLAHAVFLSAAEPYDETLSAAAARATLELARLLPGPMEIQAFVALSQTLPCFLATAWLALLQHPAEAVELHFQPELLPESIEELLRFATPSNAQFRLALAGVDLQGVQIVEGQRAILRLADANRDPDAFPEPDRLNWRRRGLPHVAFGAGAHACVGAALIRTAAAAATGVFLEYFAGAGPAAEVPWRQHFAIRSPASLSVIVPGVVVRESPIQGWGVFARKCFRAGDLVQTIDDLRVVDEMHPLGTADKPHHCDYLAAGKVVLMQFPERHINHSCDPNVYVATVDGQRVVLARRDIAAGAEITYDYCVNAGGDTVWTCTCGSVRCRHTIHSDFFHLPEELQIEYLPLLDDWFQDERRGEVERLRALAEAQSAANP